jgi:hypothetical protein
LTLKSLLKQAIALWKANRAKPLAEFSQKGVAIQGRVTDISNPESCRIRLTADY